MSARQEESRRPAMDMDADLDGRTDSPSAATGSGSASGSNSNSESASAGSNGRPRPKLQRGSRDVSSSRSPRPSNAFLYDSSDLSSHDYASREPSQSRSRSPPVPRESPSEDYSNISNVPGMSGIALAPTQLSYASATGSGGSASVSGGGSGSGSGSSGSHGQQQYQQQQQQQRHQARSASQHRQAHSQSDDASSPLLPQPSGFHFPRFGKSASTASFSTYAQQAQAQSSGSRSRQPSNPYSSSNSGGRQSIYRDLPSPRLHSDRDSDRGRDSGSEARAGTSGGTSSLSGSSAWSFFRSSSASAAKEPQPTSRHLRSDSFSSSRGALTPILSPGIEEPGTGSVTPQVLTGGTTMPQGGYTDGEGISRMSRSPLGFELSRSAAFDRQQQNKHRRMSLSASFVINEGAASLAGSSYSSISTSSSSNSAGSLSGSGFQTVSGRRRRERQMSSTANTAATAGPAHASAPAVNPALDSPAAANKRKAEGLVAMAVRRTNTAESQKVVVAGRSLLKILEISMQDDEAAQDRQGLYIKSHSRDPSPSTFSAVAKVVVKEEMDLQAGLYNISGKNSKAALVNDVSWGYDSTANTIMTGNSNGTVALYDIEKAGTKLERLKVHHHSGRAINVVSFAGPQGTLLASGCQDGDIKLSDIRHTSLITLASPLDPVRTICFPPLTNCAADPFHLMAAYDSGNICRWDLRSPKNPLDKFMAHQGGVLSIDWKGSTGELNVEGLLNHNEERRSATTPTDPWGWLATAGMDGTVKIWDMSAHQHVPSLVHTLHVGRPANFVRWHSSPSRPCDIVIVPQVAGSAIGSVEDRWQPDVEIWDVRKEYLAKQVFWTNGTPVAALSPPSHSDVLWTLNKNTATFEQIDTEKEAVEPISYAPKVAVAWSPEGSLAFAVKARGQAANVIPDNIRAVPDDPAVPHNQAVGIVPGLDPTFDVPAFKYLADEYLFKPPNVEGQPKQTLIDVCLHNIQAALAVEKHETAKIWNLVAQWLEWIEADVPPTPRSAAHPKSSLSSPKTSKALSPTTSMRRLRAQTSPSLPLAKLNKDLQHSSRHSSPLVQSQIMSEADISPKPLPSRLPQVPPHKPPHRARHSNNADLVGSDTSTSADKDESETDAEADEALSLSGKALQQHYTKSPISTTTVSTTPSSSSSSASSSSDDEKASTAAMSLSAASLITKKRPALAAVSRQASTDTLMTSHPKREHVHPMTRQNSYDPGASATPKLKKQQQKHDLLPLAEISSSALAKRATAGVAGRQSMYGSANVSRRGSMHAQRSDRPRAGSESKNPLLPSSEDESDSQTDEGDHSHDDGTAEALKARAQRLHRSFQKRGKHSHSRSRRIVSANEELRRRGGGRGSRSQSQNRKSRNSSRARALARQHKVEMDALAMKLELNAKMKSHLVALLEELAEEGDLQTSTILAYVLRQKMDIDPQFLARITSAYLGLLRRLDCHLSSSSIVKNSVTDSIRGQSQENTTLHTACGNCERSLGNLPFGKCKKCSATATVCSICHQVELETFIFCATCGHGAHEECLYSYAAELSLSPFSTFAHEYEHEEERSPPTDSPSLSIRRPRVTTPSTGPSSPSITGQHSYWLFPSEQALFHNSSSSVMVSGGGGSGSRVQSRAASPEMLEAMEESKAFLLSQCPSGCGHSCILALPLSEI